MSFKLLPLSIGCDPEVFLKKRRKRKFVSAHGLLPGTKDKPFAVTYGTVQVDGMAAEIGITPARTAGGFVNSIQAVMGTLKQMVPNHSVYITPVAEFSDDVLENTPEIAKELGCVPDYNAYTGDENPAPNGNVNFRTGSGHIHLGWTQDMDLKEPTHIEACMMLGRQMDFLVGLPSLLCEGPNKRRQLYGKAGAIRIKPYGVEYRTPSNFWLRNEDMMRMIYLNSTVAFRMLMDGKDLHHKFGSQAKDLIDSDSIDYKLVNDLLQTVNAETYYTMYMPTASMMCKEARDAIYGLPEKNQGPELSANIKKSAIRNKYYATTGTSTGTNRGNYVR